MDQKEILKKYIFNYLRKGYKIEQIQPFLIKNGWSSEIVAQTISELYNSKPSASQQPPQASLTTSNIPIIPIIIIFFFLTTIIGSIVFIINYTKDKPQDSGNKLVYNDEQLLDAKVFIFNKKISVNQDLQFTVKFLNMGTTTQKYDIFIKYEILDFETGTIIDKWQETRAILNKLEFTEKRKITDKFTSAQYKLQITATYASSDEKAITSETFQINQVKTSTPKNTTPSSEPQTEPTCFDNIKNQEEQGVDCGGPCEKKCDLCFDGIRNHGEEGIDCGGPCEKKCVTENKICDDGNVCTKNVLIEDTCYSTPITPCCSNKICEENETYKSCPIDCKQNSNEEQDPSNLPILEISKKAKNLATEDINKAGDFCSSLNDTSKKDFCFKEIAHSSLNVKLCDYIEVASTADYCYIKFVNYGDPTICEKIKTNSLKIACQAVNT